MYSSLSFKLSTLSFNNDKFIVLFQLFLHAAPYSSMVILKKISDIISLHNKYFSISKYISLNIKYL